MKVKRIKHCKKHLQYFATTFGFHEPYQVLVDLTFAQHALTCKINIKEQVSNYIGPQTQLFTTSCVLAEGEMLGPQLHGALHICKQYKLRKCGHKEPVPAQQCLQHMIGTTNAHHLFIASQDHELQTKLARVACVPLLRIHYHALVLEKPRRVHQTKKQVVGGTNNGMTEDEAKRIVELKKLHNIKEVVEKEPKEKKVKGVNPLAMLKKKKKTGGGVGGAGKRTKESSKSRSRKKKKIAPHILEHIQKQTTNST